MVASGVVECGDLHVSDLDGTCLPHTLRGFHCLERECNQLGTSVVRYRYVWALPPRSYLSQTSLSHPYSDRGCCCMARLRSLHHTQRLQCHCYNHSSRGTFFITLDFERGSPNPSTSLTETPRGYHRPVNHHRNSRVADGFA